MPFPDLLYYNMMTPAWLQDSKNKADWRRANDKTFEDLRVIVGPDTMPYERICTIPLIAGSHFAQAPANADILVKIVVGLELPDTNQVINGRTEAIDMPTKPTDPIAFLLTDGESGIGVVIQDVTKDHDIKGPYYGIQGDIGPTALSNVNTNIGQQLTRTSAKNNPDEFRLTLKPSEYWGEAYSAMDGGHKSLFFYNKSLKLKNGLNLQLCRVDPKGTYKINYIEVTIYNGSPPP
ncbi:hypothetical protein QZH41_004497 [Actinostola sp. cb2023]|nr:hypothetical protein QZH41_004497 [Actinostola sp. cb2023]